jgi:hypothetical protein
MSRKLKYFFLFLVTFQSVSAQEENPKAFTFKGYIKDLHTVSFIDHSDSLLTSNMIHNRLNFKWDISNHLYVRAELRNRIFYGETVKLIPGFGKYVSDDAGYFDLTELWLDEKSIAGVSTFDRALLNYSSERISFSIGRQRINWGVNTVWNPNDIFNAYNFLDFDYEERLGSDAVRVQYFSKKLSSMEIAFKPSKEKDRSVAAVLYKFNKCKYDFQLLSGMYYDDFVFGGGWAGNIKDMGFKGEATYFKSRNDWKAQDDFTASFTLDYSLKNSWYVSAAALYVRNPSPVLLAAMTAAGENLSVKSLMPYRWSVYAGVKKGFTPIVSGSATVIYSPEKNTFILFPSLTYSVAQNFDLDLTTQSFFSDETAAVSSGSAVYLRMRWSF